MSKWFFYSSHGKTKWKPRMSEDYNQVIQEEKPEFTTILEVNKTWEKDEERPKDVAYRGDFYLDWDGEDEISDVLDSVKRFMNKLEDKGVDLNTAQWWLTGSKGVHCVIPKQLFLQPDEVKLMDKQGMSNLPAIYRAMASCEELITDHMDFKIYTGGKGRMWRVPNLPRQLSSGKTTYKVAISPSALRKLDEEGYWEWVSEPRDPIYPAPSTKNLQMSVIFSRAFNQVASALKSRSANAGKIVKFTDWKEVPPTIAAAFKGEGVNKNLDLNAIKLQICIAAANTMYTKFSDEDRFIADISGLIQSLVGRAGAAHQTYQSIEQVMRNCFRSVVENSCYVYTAQGFASILDNGLRQNPDLFGTHTQGKQREAQNHIDFKAEFTTDSTGVIQVKPDNSGHRAISDYCWKPGSLLKVMEGDLITGYSVIPVVNGKALPRKILTLTQVQSPKLMQEHVLGLGGHIEQVSATSLSRVLAALTYYASDDLRTAPVALAVLTEGIYVQMRHTDTSTLVEDWDEALNMFWVEPHRVEGSSRNVMSDSDGNALPEPMYYDPNNPDGRFGTDLAVTKQTLFDTQIPCKDVVNALLELNGNFHSIALMLGWFTACLLKHPLYVMGRITNFPIMQVYGDSGSGKTTSINLMLKMFTWSKPFHVSAAGDGLTMAALRLMSSGSTSIPLVTDEVKAQNLSSNRWLPEYRQFLQNGYTIGGSNRKAGGTTSGSHTNGLNNAPMLAPLAFLGETLETSQTSLMERLVTPGFQKGDKVGRSEYVRILKDSPRQLSIIGWTLVKSVLETKPSEILALYNQAEKDASEKFYNGSNDRMVLNATMVLTGWRFFAGVIEKYAPNAFSSKLESLEHALMDTKRWRIVVPNEVQRLLNFLSQASYESADITRLSAVREYHYMFELGSGPKGMTSNTLIAVDRLYTLYRYRMRGLGETPIYSSEEEMYEALRYSILTLDSLDHPVLGHRTLKLDTERMKQEGIRPFKA